MSKAGYYPSEPLEQRSGKGEVADGLNQTSFLLFDGAEEVIE